MAKPLLAGTSTLEQACVDLEELGDRCYDILSDSEVLFSIGVSERDGQETFRATLAELRVAIEAFDGGLVLTDENRLPTLAIIHRLRALVGKLSILRRAIKDAPEIGQSLEMCSRIREVQKDLCLLGDSLSVSFPSILSEEGRKLLAKAFGTTLSDFAEPCGTLNEVTKFLRDPGQCEEMKKKLETPRGVVQLAASFPAPHNGGGCTVLYNHPNYLKLRAVRKGKQASADDRKQLHYDHIAGADGVGKSHYLIFDLFSTMIENVDVQDFKVVLILFKKAFAYSHSSGWFRCHTIRDAIRAFDYKIRWDTFLFADACDLSAPPCRTISVSSRSSGYYNSFSSSDALRLSLPRWTLDEVKHGFVQMSKFGVFNYGASDRRHVTQESVQAEFAVWGGIPRILYHKAPSRYTPYLLMKAMCGLNKEMVRDIERSFFRNRNTADSMYKNRLTQEDLPDLINDCLVDPVTFKRGNDKLPVTRIIADCIDRVSNRFTIDECRNRVRNSSDPRSCTRYFDFLCREVLTGGSTVHVANLEGHTNSGTNAERKVLVLKIPDSGGYWAFQSVANLLKPSYPNPGFIFHRALQENFTGGTIDAIICPPFLLFKYSASGQWEAEKDEALLKSLCTLAKKDNLDSRAEIPQTPFFIVVPNDLLLKFSLPPSSTIEPFLTKPGCACSKVPKIPKRTQAEDSEASCSRQEDTRCWYCRCLKYFHFYVMGVPGFVADPDQGYRLSPGVFTIDGHGAFLCLD